MGLLAEEIEQIRLVVREETQSIVMRESRLIKDSLERLEGKLETLENDIKDIYEMIADLQRGAPGNKEFRKLGLKAKLLRLNEELQIAANEAGVTLPK